MKSRLNSEPSLPTKQTGVVLLIALIVLIAMTLAGIAMIRSTDTGNVVAGNIAFRQAALQEADVGVDAAFTALTTGVITSTTANATPRYYAIMQTAATAPALGANGAPSYIAAMTPGDAVGTADAYGGTGFSATTGNRVRYVIERMCNVLPGSTPTIPIIPITTAEIQANCLIYNLASGNGGSNDALEEKKGAIVTPIVYYRVTVRVDGPRNTLSMAQSIIRF